MDKLLHQIKSCTTCSKFLELGPRPVLTASPKSKIALIGQAPGAAVHKTGIPWDDKSGNNLRQWLNISDETFYNPEEIALVPMGFCYPGKGKTGDLAPRKECAPQWHDSLFEKMENLEMIILVGKYAQDYYLEKCHKNLTENVRNYKDFLPKFFVLPHPSPRNNIWMKKNEWFKRDVLPEFEFLVSKILQNKANGK